MATVADRYGQLLTAGYAPDRAVAALLAALCLEAGDDTDLGAQARELVTAQIDHAAHSITALRTQLAAEPRVAAYAHVLQTADHHALTASVADHGNGALLVHLHTADYDRRVPPDQGREYVRALTGADPTGETVIDAAPGSARVVLWVVGVLTLPDGSRFTVEVATHPDQAETGDGTAVTS